MAYTPSPREVKRLERAIDLAAFSELERILWISSFLMVVFLDLFMVARRATWVGVVGSLGASLVLYARLRGVHLQGRVRGSGGLFGPGLRTREQRAFTALMLRHALTGSNPLRTRDEHDPSRWNQLTGTYESR